jgi:acyl carrier protein
MLNRPAIAKAARIDMVVRKFLRNAPAIMSPVQDLGRLGLTSLDMVNVMLALEAEFDVVFPSENLRRGDFSSIANIEALLDRVDQSAH